jgi:hypothetical protein
VAQLGGGPIGAARQDVADDLVRSAGAAEGGGERQIHGIARVLLLLLLLLA